jgi:hypothetical protein
MILSKELNEQLERYRKTRSFRLDAPLKKDLKNVIQMIKGYNLNTECGTCCRNAMRDLDYYMSQHSEVPVLQVKSNVTFVGIKQWPLEDMAFKDIKAIAKEKGIIGNFKRDKLIELIRKS